MSNGIIQFSFLTAFLCSMLILSLYKPLVAISLAALFLLLTFSLVKKISLINIIVLNGISALVVFNLSDKIGVIVLLLLLTFYFFDLINRDKFKKIIINKGNIIFFIWIFYASLQFFWVIQTDRTISYYQSLIFGAFIILLINLFANNTKKLDILFKAYGLMVVISSFIAWYESLTGNYVNDAGVIYHNLQGVATVGFFNPNDYSLMLIVSIPIFFYWIKEYSFIHKAFAWFVIITTFYVAYINETRSVIMMFFALVGFFLFDLLRKRRLIILFIIILLLIMFSLSFYDVIFDSINSISSIDRSDNSLNIRLFLLFSALDIFKSNVFGVGSGNAELYMPINGNIHNLWLEILVNYGLFIFVLLTLFFIINISKLFKERRSNKFVYPVLLSILIFIPASTISSSVFQFTIFWSLMGLMVSLNNVIGSKKLLK